MKKFKTLGYVLSLALGMTMLTGCGKKVESNKPHHYVGLTKIAINLVYLF